MQKNRPEVEISDQFRSELKSKILSDMGHIPLWRESKSSNWKMVFSVFTTACLCFILTIGMWNVIFWGYISYERTNMPLLAPEIHDIEKWAFSWHNMTAPLASDWLQMRSPEGNPSSHIEGNVWIMNLKSISNNTLLSNSPIHSYTDTGNFLSSWAELPVYKKNKISSTTAEVSNPLSHPTIDRIDLSKLQNITPSNLSFRENHSYGYIVNTDFQAGTVNMNQKSEQWAQIPCDASGCPEPRVLTKNDIPSDGELIRISNLWLDEYGIDRKLYGAPLVDSSWKSTTEVMNSIYIPQSYTVTYPLLTYGKIVHEEFGWYHGIILTIDIHTKNVTSCTLSRSKTSRDPCALVKKMPKSSWRGSEEETTISQK